MTCRKEKAILQAKQEVIAKILDDVYEALLVLDDKSYFEFIRKMLKKFRSATGGKHLLLFQ